MTIVKIRCSQCNKRNRRLARKDCAIDHPNFLWVSWYDIKDFIDEVVGLKLYCDKCNRVYNQNCLYNHPKDVWIFWNDVKDCVIE